MNSLDRFEFLLFGRTRENIEEMEEEAPWWPLWSQERHIVNAINEEHAAAQILATTYERIVGGGEDWGEIIAVPSVTHRVKVLP